MLAKIYEEGKKVEIIKFNTKQSDGQFVKVRNALESYCSKEYGNECSMSVGEMTVYINDGQLSNYKQVKGTENTSCGRSSSLIGSTTVKEDIEHDYPEITVQTENGEKKIKIGVDVYDEGFVINMNKVGSSFLGVPYDQYYNKVTRGSRFSRIYTSKKTAAKQFKNLTAVIKELEKQEYIFRSFAKSQGYEYTLEYASNFFEEVYNKSIEKSEKKKEKHNDQMKQINELLERINNVPDEEPEIKYGKSQKEEAIIRMKELNLDKKLINEFDKNGKVYISDVGGAWFDLDEEAKELIASIEKTGNIVYHILRTGIMYSALFVSKDKEYWPEERFNRKTGLIYSYATMGQGGYSSYEGGDIQVVPSHGGLSRIA